MFIIWRTSCTTGLTYPDWSAGTQDEADRLVASLSSSTPPGCTCHYEWRPDPRTYKAVVSPSAERASSTA